MNVFMDFDKPSNETLVSEDCNTKYSIPNQRLTRFQDQQTSVKPRVLNVLVIDLTLNGSHTNVQWVRRLGHVAYVARNGETAIRMAASKHPDVVLMDIDDSCLNGCQFAKQLRLEMAREDDLIIAFTDRADDVSRQQYIEAGIDLLLIEPVDPAVVETLLMLEFVRRNRFPANDAPNCATTSLIARSPLTKQMVPTGYRVDATREHRVTRVAAGWTSERPESEFCVTF